MGIIEMSHELQSNGLYNVQLKGLNNTQAQMISDLVEEWEKYRALSPWGTAIIPKGKGANNTVIDVAYELGLNAVVDILRQLTSYPTEHRNKDFVGVNLFTALNVYKHVAMWLDENVSQYDTTILIEAFYEVIPDVEGVLRRLKNAGGDGIENWSVMKEKEAILDHIHAFLAKTVKFLAATSKILQCDGQMEYDITIPEGFEEAGLTLREVYESKSLKALVDLLFKADKTTPFFKEIITYISSVLYFAESLIPYEEFITSFARLFRLSPDEQMKLIRATPEEKEKDYKDRVKELMSRMLTVLSPDKD